MAKNEKRVLRFFVSGALLAGSAACSKNKSETEENEDTVNEGPMNQDTIEHVNEGPVEVPKAATIDAAVTDADDSAAIPELDGTNTNRQELLPVAPAVPPPAKAHRTNTNRQVVPKPKAPRAPDRTNTNREFVAPKTPVTPDKP